MEEKKMLENITASDVSYELPDQFLEDKMFENLDGWTIKICLRK